MKIGIDTWGRIVRIGRSTLTAMLALTVVLVAGGVTSARAQTYSVLYSFQCGPNDGAYPPAGVVRDSAGNLYGTTNIGGTYNYGIVFKVTPDGTETVLHSFAGPPTDASNPLAGLLLDSAGNLYGVTVNGGTHNSGAVFKVAPAGSESVLYSFTYGDDGGGPVGGLVRDARGNLYGTTEYGGGWTFGTVFKLTPSGLEIVLHDFNSSQTDGAFPGDGLIRDSAGNLYGTTNQGGENNQGVIFEVTPSGTESLLRSFLGPPLDGASPGGGGGRLLMDSAGNLYGAATGGGAYAGGVIFKLLTATNTEAVLFNFNPNSKGGNGPFDGLAEDAAGNLYGTTQGGGSTQCGGFGCGVLFKLTTANKEFVLHSFTGGPTDGQNPNGGLIRDSAGNLYGTTSVGGVSGCGTVFKMTP